MKWVVSATTIWWGRYCVSKSGPAVGVGPGVAVGGILTTWVGSGWAVGEGPAIPVLGTDSVPETRAVGLAVPEGTTVTEGDGVRVRIAAGEEVGEKLGSADGGLVGPVRPAEPWAGALQAASRTNNSSRKCTGNLMNLAFKKISSLINFPLSARKSWRNMQGIIPD